MKRPVMTLALSLCCLLALSTCDVSSRMSKSLFGSEADKPQQPPCPEAGIMPEANTIPLLQDGETPDDVAATGFLGRLTGACNFDKAGEAALEIKIGFAAQKGPKGAKLKKAALPYFIAVLGPDESVLQRAAFSTKVDFDNEATGVTFEEHDLRVPVPTKEQAGAYKVVVGFELTPAQLAFNKGQKK